VPFSSKKQQNNWVARISQWSVAGWPSPCHQSSSAWQTKGHEYLLRRNMSICSCHRPVCNALYSRWASDKTVDLEKCIFFHYSSKCNRWGFELHSRLTCFSPRTTRINAHVKVINHWQMCLFFWIDTPLYPSLLTWKYGYFRNREIIRRTWSNGSQHPCTFCFESIRWKQAVPNAKDESQCKKVSL
jgi:hypothetical protein